MNRRERRIQAGITKPEHRKTLRELRAERTLGAKRIARAVRAARKEQAAKSIPFAGYYISKNIMNSCMYLEVNGLADFGSGTNVVESSDTEHVHDENCQHEHAEQSTSETESK
jgi:hypothetical protein